MIPRFFLPIFLSALCIPSASSSLSNNFRKFLHDNYGEYVANEMNRGDLGDRGSFGGGERHHPRQPTKHRPVIIVHGITNSAGTFARIRAFFRTHGYGDDEVYGTTYGDAGKTNVLFVTMNCHYMKALRTFIQVIADYTSSQVNVIGYSMGSPVARKAIMGGRCVDTGEELGHSLTPLVHTFIGVAGANYGSFLCFIPMMGVCNGINGLGCGSRFLNDVNSRHRYEGQNIYTIYSTSDDKVGHLACGHIASEIQGQNGAFQKDKMSHDQLMYDTAPLQYNLITYSHP